MDPAPTRPPPRRDVPLHEAWRYGLSWPRTAGRLLLGAVLLLAGTSHLTVARESFRAQVPPWVPLGADAVVLASGVVEVMLGAALLLLVRQRVAVGLVVAVFFVAVFPGNVSQLLTRTDAFGLDTDLARAVRLLFQPLLVLWALWATGAWRDRPGWARRG